MEQIFIKDYVYPTEIGVFDSEHGTEQRLRFNVTLTVDYKRTNRLDSLENVVSYEVILESIWSVLSGGRLNLLETLAEKISQCCLKQDEVKKIDIQIEKLDRIDGSLGVRLIREKNKSIE